MKRSSVEINYNEEKEGTTQIKVIPKEKEINVQMNLANKNR